MRDGGTRCSPGCWSWSRSAAGRGSAGRSCSSARTAGDREKGREKEKKKGQAEGTQAEVALLHVKNKQKVHPVNI